MKRFLSCLLVLTMLTCLLPTAMAESTDTSFKMETLAVSMLFAAPAYGTLMVDTLPLVFINEDYTVPYISIESYYEFITSYVQASSDTRYSVTCVDTEDGLVCYRENGSFLLFNFDNKSIYYSDQDLFEASVGAVCRADEVGEGYLDEDGNPVYDENGNRLVYYYYRVEDGSTFSCTGNPMSLSLEDSCITMFRTEEEHYLPLAVLNNLFHAGCGFQLVFNGNYLFLLNGYTVDNTCTDENGLTQRDYYYDSPSTQRSETLAELNYELFCLDLDLNYGLKEAHGITTDFDTYFTVIGLKDAMLNPEGSSFADAVNILTNGYFADFHSALNTAGCYFPDEFTLTKVNAPASSRYSNDAYKLFSTARRAAGLTADDEYGNDTILQPYMEVDNTAYITFDSFQIAYDLYGLSDEELESIIGSDTRALIVYASRQINREDSPIEHVVIDLSMNGGGSVLACIYVASWILGSANLCTTNPTTGSRYNVVTQADTNLDNIITEEDHLDLSKVDVYCLTTLNSFSCGNYLPAMLKDSGKVTMLGQTSGGGSCMVGNMVTADGTILQYSSTIRMSTVKNGSFYDVDQGVTPDFVIRKASHFYDREWLNSFIEQLP